MDVTDQDIPDSTDWLGTPLAGLAEVEAALRCEVCKDFYNTPMLTSCNHTFCSVCIRRALSNDGKCPLCRKADQELKLRGNWSMQETIRAFTTSRAAILKVAKEPPAPAIVPDSASPKHRLDDESDEDGRRSSKRLRSSARASKTRGMESTTEMARLEADLKDIEQESPEPDDGLVACPICSKRMKEVQVSSHLDSCLQEGPERSKPKRSTTSTPLQNGTSQMTTRTRVPTQNLERLPAINYSMLKENALRKKLLELGISAQGARQMLEKRHKEWMTLWNANCDALEPRRKVELLRELDSWERTQGAFAPTSSKAVNQGAQIKAKDFDKEAWATTHTDSFKDLIANARRSKAKAQAPPKEDTTETRSSGPVSAQPEPERVNDPTQGVPRPSGMNQQDPYAYDASSYHQNGYAHPVPQNPMGMNQGLPSAHEQSSYYQNGYTYPVPHPQDPYQTWTQNENSQFYSADPNAYPDGSYPPPHSS